MTSTLAGIEPIRREPLATEIARRLVDYLLSGEVGPGGRLPSERDLAQAFGVGRSAIREAIKSLSLIGLVEVRHGDGTYLRRADSSLLPQVIEWGLLLGAPRTRDLIEARQKIEVVIAGLAAERRSLGDVADLAASLALMRDAATAPDRAAFVDADVRFHLRLADAAGNTALRDILGSVQALLRAWISRVIAAGDPQVSYLEHEPILEAIERGDARAAEAAMERHLRLAAGRLDEALSEAGTAAPSDGAPHAGGR